MEEIGVNVEASWGSSCGAVTGSWGSVTGVCGSVTGSCGSVTGSCGSVTGACGSVTYSCGSVTGQSGLCHVYVSPSPVVVARFRMTPSDRNLIVSLALTLCQAAYC